MRKFPTVEEQAQHGLNIIRKDFGIRNFEVVSRDILSINSHRAAYNHIRIEEVKLGFTKSGIQRETCSIHLHCPNSGKYFVLYTLLYTSNLGQYERILINMARSFECH